MTMIQYNVQVGANGSIVIPTTPFAIGEEVEVVLRESNSVDVLPKGKTSVDDFLVFCKTLNLPSLTDEEVDQAKFDYLMEKYG